MQLLLGKPVYTDDVTPKDALVVKILRSPHANAIVESISTETAKKVPGVVDIYTWEEYPQFMQNNIPDMTFDKVENLTATEMFRKQPNFTNFVMMLRSFIDTVKEFFNNLF